MIDLVHLSKKFGSQIAVDNLNLEISKGELFGFLGPNGAGKTTTIKMMAGILRPSAGRVLINDLDIQTQPQEAKLKIGYVPDTPYLYDRLTAREFLEFMGGLFHLDKSIIEERTQEMLDLF